MKIEPSKLIRRAQSTGIYLWLPHTRAVPVADGIEMQLFYVAAAPSVSGNEICVYCTSIWWHVSLHKYAKSKPETANGNGKMKGQPQWAQQLELTATLLIVAVCVAFVATVAQWHWLCPVANHKSQLARAKSGRERASPALSLVLFCLSCVLATAETHSTFGKRFCPLDLPNIACWGCVGVAACCKFACQIPFKYSKCHRVASASAFVVGNDFVTAISICLTVCLALRLLSCCCCQEVVAAPPLSLLACHNLFAAAAPCLPVCLASLCLYNYLDKLQ